MSTVGVPNNQAASSSGLGEFMVAHRAGHIGGGPKPGAVYHRSTFARDGGLLSYDLTRYTTGVAPQSARREAGGATRSAADEMIVNLETAKALGLAIPQSILLRADHVIE
jgi:hypothetical protein